MRRQATILSTERLRQFRLQAGLSQRALARSTGFSTSQTVRALEDGRGHDDLTLRHLIRISDGLGVEPALLFDQPEGAAPTADDITLEAALAQTGRWIERDDLAATLGWKIERLATAAESLRVRLASTGQRLVTRNGRVKLIPAEGVLTSRQTQAVEELRIAERGPNLATGRVLADAVAGRIDERWQATATNSQLVEQARLLKLGWIAFTDKSCVEPSEAVRFGLEPFTPRPRATPRRRGRRPARSA